MTTTPPSELFIRRAVRVVETARALAGALDVAGLMGMDCVATDSCPIPTELPHGRDMPPVSALCGEEVSLFARIQDPSWPTLAADLVVLEDDEVRVVLQIGVDCEHRPTLQSMLRAALERLEAKT